MGTRRPFAGRAHGEIISLGFVAVFTTVAVFATDPVLISTGANLGVCRPSGERCRRRRQADHSHLPGGQFSRSCRTELRSVGKVNFDANPV